MYVVYVVVIYILNKETDEDTATVDYSDQRMVTIMLRQGKLRSRQLAGKIASVIQIRKHSWVSFSQFDCSFLSVIIVPA